MDTEYRPNKRFWSFCFFDNLSCFVLPESFQSASKQAQLWVTSEDAREEWKEITSPCPIFVASSTCCVRDPQVNLPESTTPHRLKPDCGHQWCQWKHGFVYGFLIERAQKPGFSRYYCALSEPPPFLQRPVSRTSRELFGPKRAVIILQSTCFERLIFLARF